MRNKMLSCLRYNLKKLLASPVTYLVIVLTILFVDRENTARAQLPARFGRSDQLAGAFDLSARLRGR